MTLPKMPGASCSTGITTFKDHMAHKVVYVISGLLSQALSQEALEALAKDFWGKNVGYDDNSGYFLVDEYYATPISRHDPRFVEVIEKLGERAGKVRVVELQGGQYRIERTGGVWSGPEREVLVQPTGQPVEKCPHCHLPTSRDSYIVSDPHYAPKGDSWITII